MGVLDGLEQHSVDKPCQEESGNHLNKYQIRARGGRCTSTSAIATSAIATSAILTAIFTATSAITAIGATAALSWWNRSKFLGWGCCHRRVITATRAGGTSWRCTRG